MSAPSDDISPRPAFKLGNRPPLTGIRAFGIALVLVFHSNGTSLPGAWVALSMFFVLSGFLITAMLLAEDDRLGRISLRNFYARRAARLLPPLLLAVALLAIYSAFVPVADASHRIWGDSLATMFYFADYRSAFGHEPFLGYFGQAWSLSVEEQFYVVWAIALFTAVAFRRRGWATALAVTGVLACTANRLWIVYHAASYPGFHDAVAGRVYYAFDTRADALFLGCLLGIAANRGLLGGWSATARRVLIVVALVGGALMGWAAWNVGLLDRSLPIIWIPVTELATMAMIVYFVIVPGGLASRFIGLGIFVYLGNLSYTIYLIHWAVYLEINPERFPWGFWPIELFRLAVILAIASASWFLMERRLMHWRRHSLDRAPPSHRRSRRGARARAPAPAAAPASAPAAAGGAGATGIGVAVPSGAPRADPP